MSTTTVAELARALDLPPSAVLDQCHRFGIPATWAGAGLGDDDIARLRLALVHPADEAGEAADQASPASTAAARPTTGASQIDPTAVQPSTADEAGGRRAERPGELPPPAPGDDRRALSTAPPLDAKPDRRLDRSTRHAVIWLLVASALLGVSLAVRSPWAIWPLWFAGAGALAFALFDANRGRRQAVLHPERFRGLGVAVTVLIAGTALGAALVAGVAAAVRSEPASDVPVVGDLESVSSARWGFHRVVVVAGHGWRSPAKRVGTCWRFDPDGAGPRQVDRVEVGDDRIACERPHIVEVLSVFSMGADVDAPYPGLEGFLAEAEQRCADAMARIEREGTGALLVEYPTEEGWADADHDVACAVRYAERRLGPLAD